jgi:hypothetical protein
VCPETGRLKGGSCWLVSNDEVVVWRSTQSLRTSKLLVEVMKEDQILTFVVLCYDVVMWISFGWLVGNAWYFGGSACRSACRLVANKPKRMG